MKTAVGATFLIRNGLWVIAVPNVIKQKVSKERKNITNAVKTVVTKNLPQLIPYFTK